jgi:RNA polymerase sigma factor (sigma-70 family)
MDVERLVQRARQGDVGAFVALTRGFQHVAFGSALAVVRDFHQAEDVAQEAFVAAWAALPSLADPAAFPGWLRGIVRHHAFRVVRRKRPPTVPLAAADDVAGDEPAADRALDARQQAAAALAAMAELPAKLREPATLFFVHECSHQDIAVFLGLSATTVNNRLHAARHQLKRRMTMVKTTLEANALPDEFANRIGRLIAARGEVVEALFDPSAPPDILAELAVSDEVRRRGVTLHVVQRPGGGVVRAVAISPIDPMPRGATVLNSGRHTTTPVSQVAFDRLVPLLASQAPATDRAGVLLETGIKVIDVMCPFAVGGTVAIAGEFASGTFVVLEEIVRRLGRGSDPLSFFTLVPQWEGFRAPGYSFAEGLKEDGYSEGTMGPVQTFFFWGDEGPWTQERLAALAAVDTVIHLSRKRIGEKIYPGVDVMTSRSRVLETRAVSDAHRTIAARVRDAIALLRAAGAPPGGGDVALADFALERARKLQNFFGQPFTVAEEYTKRPGTTVTLSEALAVCGGILDGEYDDWPTEAFYFAGGIDEIRARAGR